MTELDTIGGFGSFVASEMVETGSPIVKQFSVSRRAVTPTPPPHIAHRPAELIAQRTRALYLSGAPPYLLQGFVDWMLKMLLCFIIGYAVYGCLMMNYTLRGQDKSAVTLTLSWIFLGLLNVFVAILVHLPTFPQPRSNPPHPPPRLLPTH